MLQQMAYHQKTRFLWSHFELNRFFNACLWGSNYLDQRLKQYTSTFRTKNLLVSFEKFQYWYNTNQSRNINKVERDAVIKLSRYDNVADAKKNISKLCISRNTKQIKKLLIKKKSITNNFFVLISSIGTFRIECSFS